VPAAGLSRHTEYLVKGPGNRAFPFFYKEDVCMAERPEDAESPETCPICQKPFVDGEAVVQVVEDCFPTFDREIILHTYHRACFNADETVTHECPHCGCMFHLALIRQGDDYQNLSWQLFCPFCATLFDCQMGS
jgi:hypothetical protein